MKDIVEFDFVEHGVTTEFIPSVTYSIVFSNNATRVNLASAATSSALALDANTANWVFEAAKRLDSLGRLPRNWDSYDGLPLSPSARLITFDALGWLKRRELPVPAVVLGSDGTVHLEWRSAKGKELDVGFGVAGALEYAKMDRSGNIEEGHADAEIREELCKLTTWLNTD